LARIALCLGGDPVGHPVTLAELAAVAKTKDPRANELNAMLVADLIRGSLRAGGPVWRPDQIEVLEAIAAVSPKALVSTLRLPRSRKATANPPIPGAPRPRNRTI